MSQRGPGDDRWDWKRDAKGNEYRIDAKTSTRVYRQKPVDVPRRTPTVAPGPPGSNPSAGTIQSSIPPSSSPAYTYGASPHHPGADGLKYGFDQMNLVGLSNSRGNSSFSGSPPSRQPMSEQIPLISASSPPRANQVTTTAGAAHAGAPNAALMKNIATPLQQKTLHEDYQLRKYPSKYFQLGKVFLTVHTEAHGESRKPQQKPATAETKNQDVFVVAYSTLAFSKVRRFVVVREGTNSCSALWGSSRISSLTLANFNRAISTHSGNGAARNDVSDHGVVYTGLQPPTTYKYEEGILPVAIRIDPMQPANQLHPKSRLNYGKVYTIEHNVRVKPYGIVNKKSMHVLMHQFTLVFFRNRPSSSVANAIRQPSRQNLQALGFNDQQMNVIIGMIMDRGASHDIAISSVAFQSTRPSFDGNARQQELAQYAARLVMAGMTIQQAVEHVTLVEEKEDSAGINDDKALYELDDVEDDDDDNAGDDDE